jgi:hypothetical protein
MRSASFGPGLVALVLLACDPKPADENEAVVGAGPAIGVPPLLDEGYHPGWTNPNCGNCHPLPVEGHTAVDPHVCAQCHGANGACLLNGYNDEYNEHQANDDCNACHRDAVTQMPGNHGFTDAATCNNCHMRELGQRACEEYMPPMLPDPADATGEPPQGEPPTLSDARVTDCFGFPEMSFGPANGVPKAEIWSTQLQPGDQAVDFTLPDTDGQPHTLSELLAQGPVWLQLGNYTCPVYQEAVREALNVIVASDGPEGPYAERIQFVHVYTVEAHPTGDEPGPYPVGDAEYSTLEQPVTFDGRLGNARQMEPIVDGELMLVDGLGSQWGNNPVWCTYATCPTCSFLIGRDGYVYEVITRTPADIEDLTAPLDAFLATQGG